MEFKQDYYGLGIFLLSSIAFLIWWVWARLGYDKRWFIAPWPVVSKSFYFALPTAMLGLIIGLIGLLLPSLDPNADLVFVAFGFWGISFVIAFLEPGWMAPTWYRWLKKEHGDIMPYLVLDAHEMGRQAWMRRVETQAGLEEWAEEVRRKYRR
jgi:hypothetical protein